MNRPDETQPSDETPQARVHLPKWSPWVWIVPTVAILIAGWFVVRYGFSGGDITVHFADARGLERYSPVRYRGAKVGTVQKITVGKDLGEVVVRISMDSSMNHALRQGTKFWIVEPGLEGGGLGGLLAGTNIGIAPGDGAETREFIGQEYAPVLPSAEKGKTFILEAQGLGSVAVGSPVQFQGVRVGRILGASYDEKSNLTFVHAFVVQRFADDVREGTRFWRGGGINLSLSGGGISSGGTSLSSLITAPIVFSTPEVLAGPAAAAAAHFQLYESQALAEAATDGANLTYLTYFRGSVKGLTPGTPVQMSGIQIGRVRDVRLRYVPETASLETPVTLEIDPRTMQFPVSPSTTPEELRARMNDALAKLVQKGMRASLSSSLVLPGASAVSLDITAAPGSARLGLAHDPPIIPAADGGSGLEGALASINDIAGKIRNIPIEEITGHLRNASQKIDALVSDPALHESVMRLNRSIGEIDKNVGPLTQSLRKAATSAEGAASDAKTAVDKVKENVDPIVQSLRNAASSAESAAKRADQLIGSSPRQNYDLGQLIKELTQAAEAVRALASYLSENPDALLKGRAK